MRQTFALLFFLSGAALLAQKNTLDSLRTVAAREPDLAKKRMAQHYVVLNAIPANLDLAQAYTDSLEVTIGRLGQPEIMGHVYSLRAQIAQERDNPAAALELYQRALSHALEHKHPLSESRTYVNMAGLFVDMGKMDEAVRYYRMFQQKALPDTTADIRSMWLTAQTGLGIALKNQNKLAEAAEESKIGLERAQRYGAKRRIWNFYDNLAMIYGRMGDYKTKLDYSRRALAVVPLSDPFVTTVWNNMGAAFLMLGQSDSAAIYYEKTLHHPTAKWKSLIHAYDGLSQVHFEKGDYQRAYDYSLQAVPLAEKSGNAMTKVAAQTQLGKNLMGLKRYAEAIATFRKTLAIMDADKDYAFIEERANVNKYLAQAIALEQGAPAVADLINEYVKGRDSIHNFAVTHTIEQARIQFETRQKEDSLLLLQAHNQLQISQSERYKMGLFGGLALAAALAGLYFLARKNLRLEKTENRFLAEKNRELLANNQQLLTEIGESAQPRAAADLLAERAIVLTDRDKTRVPLADILFVEAQGNGVFIHTLGGGKIWEWQSLGNFAALLPPGAFLKIHRSHIVNLSKIKSRRARLLVLHDGTELPIGASFRPAADAALPLGGSAASDSSAD
ncbi:MAG: tetratricopeptide repeat protein [Saprospiraceae bacterium]